MVKSYIYITKDYINTDTPNTHKVKDEKDGIKYFVDGKNIVLNYSQKEYEVALWPEPIFRNGVHAQKLWDI